MTRYKLSKMNTGFGDHVFAVNRVDLSEGREFLVPVTPIRYYKTKKGANKRIKELLLR